MNNKTRAVINILSFNIIFSKSFQSFSLDHFHIETNPHDLFVIENDPMERIESFH